MSAALINNFGTITYEDNYIATIAGINASECYGLLGMSDKHLGESIVNFFNSDNTKRGVSIRTDGSENVEIDLRITAKYGVSLAAVAENIIDKVKYSLEKDTGLNIKNINIIIQNIEL